MSDHRIIRTVIAAVLAGLDAGPVHQFERYMKEKRSLVDAYTAGDRLQGWYIQRRSFLTANPQPDGTVLVTTRWRIRFFMALKDDDKSELIFDDLLDAALAATAESSELQKVVRRLSQPLRLEEEGPVLFAGVLCHSADMSLESEHIQLLDTDAQAGISRVMLGQAPEIGTLYKDEYREISDAG